MLVHMHVWGRLDDDDDWRRVLNAAFDDFTQWRKIHKIQCSQKRFTYKTVIRKDYGHFLNAKGYNARVLSEWLLAKIVEIRGNPGNLILDERFDLTESTLMHGPDSE